MLWPQFKRLDCVALRKEQFDMLLHVLTMDSFLAFEHSCNLSLIFLWWPLRFTY